jgi:hypothetical protein
MTTFGHRRATELADAHNGKKPTSNEIVPYWQDVSATNENDLRSQNPKLVYPAKLSNSPELNDDDLFDGSLLPSSNSQSRPTTSTTSIAPTAAATMPTVVTVPLTTIPATTFATSTVVEEIPANIEIVDDVDTNFEIPWLQGLAVTGLQRQESWRLDHFWLRTPATLVELLHRTGN